MIPFKLRYCESKGFVNEQGPSTVPQTNFKGLENVSFLCYGYKIKTELPRKNGMNKQLTHLEAGHGNGQFWQEELPLGREGQAGQRGAELGVH